MDWRAFNTHGANRGAEFYFTALLYGHYLWQRGRAARAILCLDRAFGADLRGGEPGLANWPLPYAALVWFLQKTPPGIFLGNPRVHFQHLAGRMNQPRSEQRRWRAWACWALTRAALPHLPDDPRHRIAEPSIDLIAKNLIIHGLAGEMEQWRAALHTVCRNRPH
ncbi:MAG: hypothetical protein KGJ37_03775 [Verrucomicrobiota bacterium]|nr:hypothetical protein [Verrucomicrobiota bacterium]